ncbi:MAG TPA: helix-turn-helix domain-containing protein [Allosphingosinicella sp.]|nr:helix-turn-helix domain-containing protein [Allosphingosinicella sp.]
MKLENVTDMEHGSSRRRYDDACAATHGMDIIGERWALPVMRELMLGPRRFGELKSSLRGISANVLTQRLEGLEAAGVVKRTRLPPPASVQVYELTAWGYEAGPIFQAMGRWAVKSPAHDPSRPFSAVSLMLSFRTMMDLSRTEGLQARIGFRIGEDSFVLGIADRAVTLGRGDTAGCDLIFIGPTSIIGAAAYGGAALAELERAGELTIEGDRALAERFVTLFPLPPKADAS